MPRILVAVLALLSLTSAARSDTPPSPTTDVHAPLFNQTRPDRPLLRSVTSRAPSHSAAVTLSCCKVCTVGEARGNSHNALADLAPIVPPSSSTQRGSTHP